MNPIGTIWFYKYDDKQYRVVKTGPAEFKSLHLGKYPFVLDSGFSENLLDFGWRNQDYLKQYNGRWINVED